MHELSIRTFEPVGLSDADYVSFDTTKVNDFLQRFTDPRASCEIQKLTFDGRKLVVIDVSEFSDVPIICKKDTNSSKESSRLILKSGALYIRTDKATSVQVPSVEEMRELLNRAMLKRSDQLLETIEGLFKGNPRKNESEIQQYDKEINAAIKCPQAALVRYGPRLPPCGTTLRHTLRHNT